MVVQPSGKVTVLIGRRRPSGSRERGDLVAFASTLERFDPDGPWVGRLYAEQDADDDVTSLSNSSGSVVERYAYDPYGAVTVENADGTTRGDRVGRVRPATYGWAVPAPGA